MSAKDISSSPTKRKRQNVDKESCECVADVLALVDREQNIDGVVSRWAATAIDDDEDDEAKSRSIDRLIDVVFEFKLKRTHRVALIGLRKGNARAAEAFARRAYASVAAARASSVSSSEAKVDDEDFCLRACAPMCLVFAAKPRTEFERIVAETTDADAVAETLARGFAAATARARACARATPESVELLCECTSLALDLVSQAKGKSEKPGFRALVEALAATLELEQAPSRDAVLTAGVAVARANYDESDHRMSIVSFAKRMYGRASGGPGLELTSTATPSLVWSKFGALAAARGFVITAEANALTTPYDKERVLMYDDVLPGVCDAIESAEDAHYRFHAAACLRTCLDKTREAAATPPDALLDRVAWIISTQWEDPLGQTVREIQASFEALLDIAARKANGDAFLDCAARQIVARPSEHKGKYLALRSLIARLGATRLLLIEPELLRSTLNATRDLSIAPAASITIAELSKSYLAELADTERWRAWWIESIVHGITRDARDRSAVTTYILPVFLKQDPHSAVELMTRLVSRSQSGALDVIASAAVVSALKVCRSLNMCDADCISIVKPTNDAVVEVPIRVLEHAMASADRAARLDALEFLCLDWRKGAARFPGALELRLLREMLPLNLRGCVLDCVSLLTRAHVALEPNDDTKPLRADFP